MTQPPERGALPQLFAATAPGVRGGQFFGPARLWETRGRVVEVRPVRRRPTRAAPLDRRRPGLSSVSPVIVGAL
ncbi:hypothetical protein [Microbispora bryophytorum]|uniref:hypothetical protein n=1 Tax=Microbispora bryophytorum TaxID=1460882 RepID=UPI001CC32D1E|nr:hypothetical protein [Microbispora camponoti]